jgi:hypothetical protein
MILLPFHAKQLQPWMPTMQFGMELSGAQGGSFARQVRATSAPRPSTIYTPKTTVSTRAANFELPSFQMVVRSC